MSSTSSPLPPDDPKRSLTIAQQDNLPHIGLVGDTYTITVTGEQTAGRFCVIDMHIPPGGGPPPHRHESRRPLFSSKARWRPLSAARSRPSAPARR